MDSLEHYTKLVDLIYQTATEPEVWPEALAQIQASFSGCGAILGVERRNRPQFLEISGYDRNAMDRFGRDYADKSFVWSQVPQTAEGTLLHDRCVMPDSVRQRDVFANEWAVEYETTDCAIFPLWRREDLSAFAIFARSPGCGVFDQEALDFLTNLSGHLQRSIKLQARLDLAELDAGMALDALDLMEDGILLVTADSRVSFANKAALRLFSSSASGLSLQNSQIKTRNRDAGRALEMLLVNVFGGKSGPRVGGSVVLEREAGGRPIIAYCAPLSTKSEAKSDRQPAALLLFSDTATKARTSARLLREIFGLSGAEARLASHLADGANLSDAASTFGVAKSTVISQLSSIFLKTRTSRQSEMVKLFRDLPRLSLDGDM